MKERLEEVIKRIILPHYPLISDFRVYEARNPLYKVNTQGYLSRISNDLLYSVWYLMDKKLHNSRERESVVKDTETLFNMLGPNGMQSIQINTTHHGDEFNKKHFENP